MHSQCVTNQACPSWKHECQRVASWYQECLAFHGGTILSGIKGWHVHRALGRYIVAGICDAYVQEWKKNKLQSIRLIVPCEPSTTTLDSFFKARSTAVDLVLNGVSEHRFLNEQHPLPGGRSKHVTFYPPQHLIFALAHSSGMRGNLKELCSRR